MVVTSVFVFLHDFQDGGKMGLMDFGLATGVGDFFQQQQQQQFWFGGIGVFSGIHHGMAWWAFGYNTLLFLFLLITSWPA